MHTQRNKKTIDFQPSVSLIVCTKDRPTDLKRCLTSLADSTFKDYELIVVDQSMSDQTQKLIKKSFPSARYFHSSSKGLSKGRNWGIRLSKARLLAFTDDDCIVDRFWLEKIVNTFHTYPKVLGVFGKTSAYQAAKNNALYCPSIFESKRKASHIISKPSWHWEEIGYGNNMAFRKEAFKRFGLFKEKLGAGSIGKSAEEAEVALRILTAGQMLFYNQHMIIYHNRWITREQYQELSLEYIRGGIACYGYLALLGSALGRKYIKNNVNDLFSADLKAIAVPLLSLDPKFFSFAHFWMKKTHATLCGLGVSLLLHNEKKKTVRL